MGDKPGTHDILERKHTVGGDTSPELMQWLKAFKDNRDEAALSYWYETHKGIHESLREF